MAGFICLWWFLANKTVRIVTTSVKDKHLIVLWGEIGRFISTSKYPLTVDKGGPLIFNHHDIRKVVDGQKCRISYLIGQVSEKGEGMAGHHSNVDGVPTALQVIDEASGVADEVYTQGSGWAARKLIFGNPNTCSPNHFFRRGVTQGDLLAKE